MRAYRESKSISTPESTGTAINRIVRIYSKEAARIFGDKLRAVILFGSYARGDFDEESDIDLMVLLDLPREQITDARKKMRITADKFGYGI